MRARLLKIVDLLRTSFWFLPVMMAVGAVALALASVSLDEAVAGEWLRAQGWIYTTGTQGASTVLGTIAGSMITIAGVVFSLTLVSLSLAASQFGPHLLRNFMRDTTTQVVLGTFVATFIYCLLVLRTIHGDESAVPHLSVNLGVVLAFASLVVLIYFIHHVAISIQSDEVVANVATDLHEGIERLFPGRIGEELPPDEGQASDATLPDSFEEDSRTIEANRDGYLQLIDREAVLKTAIQADLIIRFERRPGHYVIEGVPLMSVWPHDRVEDKVANRLHAAFVIGKQRTPVQDIEFAIEQLVEVAVRALSPSMNDPFTAISCVDRLGSALCRLASRDAPSPYRFDDAGDLRVVAPGPSFPDITDTAFDQIRQNARSNAAVTIRLLEAIALVATAADRPEDRAALRRHADMILRGAREALPEQEDRAIAEARYRAVERALGKSHSEETTGETVQDA